MRERSENSDGRTGQMRTEEQPEIAEGEMKEGREEMARLNRRMPRRTSRRKKHAEYYLSEKWFLSIEHVNTRTTNMKSIVNNIF